VKPRHPVHLAAFDYLGPYRYSLRFATSDRRAVFVTTDSVDLVWSQILRAAGEQAFAVIAYCFMPDHLHLLIEGVTADADLRRFVARAKQCSGFYYAQRTGCRLWQRYGYERVLRSDELTPVVARYILQNPVRAGLVARLEDYPFLGSGVWTLAQLLEWLAATAAHG
jgi:putative transposase